MTYITGAVSAPSGLADGIARNESRRVGPGGRNNGRLGRRRIVAHRLEEVKTGGRRSQPTRVRGKPLKQWLTAANPRRKLLHKMVPYYHFSGKVPGTDWRLPSFLLARQRLKHRRGRHVDFAVYARLRRRGLSGCGSRDDGARRAATPAPLAISAWRDLSGGRPRAARNFFV